MCEKLAAKFEGYILGVETWKRNKSRYSGYAMNIQESDALHSYREEY
jgi:hypothetical protein